MNRKQKRELAERKRERRRARKERAKAISGAKPIVVAASRPTFWVGLARLFGKSF